jgi:hypothetical protein
LTWTFSAEIWPANALKENVDTIDSMINFFIRTPDKVI